MSTIQDTAYPQLKKDLSARELAAIYTPTADECAFAMGVSARKPTQALLLIQLKIIQRLGYFELLSTLPRVIVDHVCRSEEHTSELQSLMRISYAVFCLKKKKHITN